MSKTTFNLKDTSFAHVPYSVAGKESKYVTWDRSCNDPSRPTFYTNEQIFNCTTPPELSYGLIFESKPLLKKVFKRAPKVLHQFKHVFTYDPVLLKRYPETVKFCPGGGIWIGGDYGEGEFGLRPKSKLVSMVSSGKRSCNLHRFRYRVAKKLLKKGVVDVFGFDNWVPIHQTVDDYMFSIVVENNNIDNYFTEKLLNCFAVGTIPIYLGCKNVEKFFDPGGIITISRFSNLKKIIAGLSAEEYHARQASIAENYKRCQQYEVIEDYIFQNYFA